MESSECSTHPSLGEDIYPKSPSVSDELDQKKPLSPLRPKTPNSPDPNCAICLGKLQNTSFTDSCLHQFCFTCLLEWSKVKPECPLCKQTFKSIIHNVRSIEDYDQYHLHPTGQAHPMWPTFDVEFRRRRTMFPGGLWHTPTLIHGRSMQALLPGEDAVIPSMSRLPVFRIREVVSAEFRRTIYERNMWAEPLCDVTGRFRDCTAEFFRQNEAAVHRLLPWLNRELDAVLWNGVNKSHVLELVLNLLPRYNIGSSEFRSQLVPYLRGYVTHFLHEFYNFARSPYDMIGFDRSVNYSHAGQRQFLVVSSDSDSDDVLVLTSPERERSVAASCELLTPLSRNDDAVAGSSQQATTSYEHAMEQLARRMIEHDSALNSDHSTVDLEVNDSDSDCMIVGFVKPRHERTPEIITLPSDEERRQRAEDVPRRVSQSLDLMSSSESSLSSQTSDSDYSPSKGHSKCAKKKTRKGRKETKVMVKEKPKKSHQRSSHRSHKSTSSGSKVKKFKRIKELFSSTSSSLSSSSSTSSSSDEESHSKKKSKRFKKLSHYKGTWHVKMRGTSYDEDEAHRDHNYMVNHNPPYAKEEIEDMQLQSPRNPPKLKSIVITRTFADASPSVSSSSSHHQSRTSSSKHSHSHSHRSSQKRNKHDKKRCGKSDKRRSRFSSDLSTSKTKSRRSSELCSSDSDDYF